MQRRQPLPRVWLMTDERQGEGLRRAIRRLPRGAGIVFRHYNLSVSARRSLFDQVKAEARRRNLILLLAGADATARAWGANGSHGRQRGKALHSAPVHSLRELRAAERNGARLLFVSPVFRTRSHPSAMPLGRVRFGLIARQTRLPVIALGGVTKVRAAALGALGAYGWAAIDAWS